MLPGTIADLAKLIPPERIHVVDDGSTDGTAEVARSLGCTVHRLERSKGKASAINYAIHRVRTPLVLLLEHKRILWQTLSGTMTLKKLETRVQRKTMHRH